MTVPLMENFIFCSVCVISKNDVSLTKHLLKEFSYFHFFFFFTPDSASIKIIVFRHYIFRYLG